MGSGLKPDVFFRFYFRSLRNMDKELLRFTYKDDGCVYVRSYRDLGKDYEITIRNTHGLTGEEILRSFIVPKSNVRLVEPLE